MNEPLFSILIANYNNGQFLMGTVESVYAQTYANWEIIIVDDGSTDNSKKLYEELKNDARIKIYYNDENKGCGYTKRRCAELANGEICGFLDSDDVLLPDALATMIRVHSENPSVSLVLSRFYNCDDKLNVKSESRLLVLPEGKSYLEHADYMPEVFASFKKIFYDKTDGLSAEYKIGVDQDLYFKLEEVGSVKVLDKFTYKYRYGIGISRNPTRTFWGNSLVRIDACRRRNLSVDTIGILQMENYANYLCAEAHREGENSVRKSKAYRLGRFLLKPFKWVKRMIN